MKSFLTFFYKPHKSVLEELTEQQYLDIFVKDRTPSQIKETYDRAWEAKNFEIEHYWKRANYFWAFQIASFAGYFSVLSSKGYTDNPQILYSVVCIGFLTALAWTLINKGSKTWQRHWEIHVDMLEDQVTGPLYKIITAQKTFSVSKINEIVSRFIVIIWITLGFKYFSEHITFKSSPENHADLLIWISSIAVFYFTGAMFWGYGRGRFGDRRVTFYRRKFSTTN